MQFCKSFPVLRRDVQDHSSDGSHRMAGLSLEGKPNVQKWLDRNSARPGTAKGLDVPEPNPIKKMANDPEAAKKAIEDAKNMMVSTDAKK